MWPIKKGKSREGDILETERRPTLERQSWQLVKIDKRLR
jgi:hypothetical protein